MPPDLRATSEAFAQELKETFPDQVERVILFGSVARGDASDRSDVDLLIVVRDKAAFDRAFSRFLGRWMARTGVLFQTAVVTPDEFEAMGARGSSFAHAVRDEGVPLVG